jgi:hypothetical protein
MNEPVTVLGAEGLVLFGAFASPEQALRANSGRHIEVRGSRGTVRCVSSAVT